ncbi:hypothetical protein PAPYR_9609 [Paratrimastix pyriformis]|uniref:Uncharacterized protein n=1 Tax=Paratrimastix pyriformis TaxID=342808 RepID=A0ABQ8UC45_9EUKA|nr:hypothetical protein PAPYR_9609 [Paratrimastix pyriformis]
MDTDSAQPTHPQDDSDKQRLAAEAEEMAEVGGATMPPEMMLPQRAPLTILNSDAVLMPTVRADMKKWLRAAWTAYKQHYLISSLSLVVWAGLLALGALVGRWILAPGLSYVYIEEPTNYWAAAYDVFLDLLCHFPLFFFVGPLRVSFFTAIVQAQRKGTYNFLDFFRSFRFFFKLLLVEVIIWMAALCGSALLILPGIAAVLFTAFTPLAVVYLPELGLVAAFRCTLKQTIRHWTAVVMLEAAVVMMWLLGAAAGGLGFLVAYPVSMYFEAYAFMDYFVPRGGLPSSGPLTTQAQLSHPTPVSSV